MHLYEFYSFYSCYFSDTLALVNKYAPSLVNTLLIMLSGHMPAYALDESNGCIADVLWYLRKRLLTEFRVSSSFKNDIIFKLLLFSIMYTYILSFKYLILYRIGYCNNCRA